MRMVDQIPYGKPFRTQDIAHHLAGEIGIPFERAKALTNNQLKRIADKNQIERLDKGVYFRAKQTPFGVLRPSAEQYAIQTLTQQDGKTIGYESGAGFLNRLALTTLIPKNIEIVTNAYRKKLPEDCRVTVRKPVTEITNKNYLYLQLLDAVNELPKAHVDALGPEAIFKNYAGQKKLDLLKLIGFARKYYSQKTLFQVVDIFTGGMFN
ncbi:MAG: DUF6088 family protein [Clostridiales bacterium]|nr:DUF6088 family protein [Clostridiales bacterium]